MTTTARQRLMTLLSRLGTSLWNVWTTCALRSRRPSAILEPQPANRLGSTDTSALEHGAACSRAAARGAARRSCRSLLALRPLEDHDEDRADAEHGPDNPGRAHGRGLFEQPYSWVSCTVLAS